MISQARVEEILAALTGAGESWPATARRLPEFHRLHLGRPPGPGMVRPWVQLHGPHEDHVLTVRLLRHESGVWFTKGETTKSIERRARTWQ